MRAVIIDTETTGLPDKPPSDYPYRWYHARDFKHYDGARVVQIAWVILVNDRIISKTSFVIRPDNYIVPNESTAIHGISHENAVKNGVPFYEAANKLKVELDKCDIVVAHNMKFDMSIILAECYRYKLWSIIDTFYKTPRFDTMWEGRKDLNLGKVPKLVELHKLLFNKDYHQVHDALDDALLATKCFSKIIMYRKHREFKEHNSLRPRHMIRKPNRFKHF